MKVVRLSSFLAECVMVTWASKALVLAALLVSVFIVGISTLARSGVQLLLRVSMLALGAPFLFLRAGFVDKVCIRSNLNGALH